MFRIAICDDEREFGNRLNEEVKNICKKNSIEYKSDIFTDGLSLIGYYFSMNSSYRLANILCVV